MSVAQQLERALKAIQTGNAQEARSGLETFLADGQGDATLYITLAVACRNLGDPVAMERALDAALGLEPTNINGLIMKGDLLAARMDMPAAAGYYNFVIKLAAQSGSNDPELLRLAEYARQCLGRSNAVLSGHLVQHLQQHGYDPATSPPRFTHALDLLTGKKKTYEQRPRAFYYPELPQIQFFDRTQFPWLAELEAATPDIAKELMAVMEERAAFMPYLQADTRIAGNDPQKVRDNEGWRAYFLWKDGEPVEEHIKRCPKTMAALAQVPLFNVPKRSPSILFSLLQPGARIAPHTGFINTRLICHLPLFTPPDCGFRVGNEERPWITGKTFVFDDTIEHEAWNSSDQTRVVLLFDIWRPELSTQEQGLIASLLQGVDSFSGEKTRWNV